MTFAAARRLARYFRALGYQVRLQKHALPATAPFYTVQKRLVPSADPAAKLVKNGMSKRNSTVGWRQSGA